MRFVLYCKNVGKDVDGPEGPCQKGQIMCKQASIPHRPARPRLMVLLLAGAAIAAPVTIDLAPGKAPTVSAAFAHARGGDDGGGDDNGGGRGGGDGGGRGGDSGGGHGRGGDDGDGGGRGRGGDDGGGGRGRGGDSGGGRGGDDHGGRGRGGDDGPGDDHSGRDRGRGADDGAMGHDRGRGRGRDDGPTGRDRSGGIGRPADGTPVRLERSARGVEVTYADGWREELENGRYELKDAQNRTVVERPATQQDYNRLGAIAR